MLQRISNFSNMKSDGEPLKQQNITDSAMEDSMISSSTQPRIDDQFENTSRKR